MQLINRVGWDGAMRGPEPNELGYKETVRMNPLEDIIVALRPVIPNLPADPRWDLPYSIRPMDVTMPVGSTLNFTNVDPTGQPAPVTNALVNFGWEYTWHCHLLGHEENDMMRPVIVAAPPMRPTLLTAAVTSTTTTSATVTLTWQDNSRNESGFIVQRATAVNGVTGAWATVKTVGANKTSTTDTVARNATYAYQVIATASTTVFGYTQKYNAPAVGYPTTTSFDSTPSGVLLVTVL